MTAFSTGAIHRLTTALASHRDTARAAPMAAYMRNLFPFLGMSTTERRSLTREALAGMPKPDEADLAAFTDACWSLPEREYQYAALDVLSRHQGVCGPGFLAVVERLVTTKSWWDTVDGLASGVAGPLVARNPELVADMDRWIASDNFWLARTAILHQLRYKGATDAERLFRYCELRAGDREFFLRKAIGWALREYSKIDAEAVRGFVVSHADVLSPLSRREALLWLNGGRKQGAPPTADRLKR
jgi:3-methyladenine DNA glycosylase AlkD